MAVRRKRSCGARQAPSPLLLFLPMLVVVSLCGASGARGTGGCNLSYLQGIPAWSPDGASVAYLDTPDATTCDVQLHAYVVASGGGKRLDLGPANGEPQWSPDGSDLLFSQPSGDLRIAAKDGSDTRVIGSGYAPKWSPTGTEIGYINSQRQVAIVDADGRNNRIITLGGSFGAPLSWSYDGRLLAFYGNDSTTSTVYVYGLDDATLRSIASSSAYPTWSPNSWQLVYETVVVSGNFNKAYLLLANADGSNARTLAETAPVGLPEWSPSGDAVAFTSPDASSVNVVAFPTGPRGRSPA